MQKDELEIGAVESVAGRRKEVQEQWEGRGGGRGSALSSSPGPQFHFVSQAPF